MLRDETRIRAPTSIPASSIVLFAEVDAVVERLEIVVITVVVPVLWVEIGGAVLEKGVGGEGVW